MKVKPLLLPFALAAGILHLASCGKSDSPTASTGSPSTSSAPAGDLGDVELLDIEKDTLKFGFIKLTDCAPIVIAKEKGYFDDEGLSVAVEAQGNWKELLNRVINGDLDGAHMLAGQPIGATVGFGTQADIVGAIPRDETETGELRPETQRNEARYESIPTSREIDLVRTERLDKGPGGETQTGRPVLDARPADRARERAKPVSKLE